MTDNEPKRPYYQPKSRAENAESQPPTDQPAIGQQPTIGSQPTVSSQRTVQAPPPTQAAGAPPASQRSGSAPARTSSTPSSSGWGQAGHQASPPPPVNPPPARRVAPPSHKPRRKLSSYGVFKALFFVGLIGVALLVCGVATGVVGYVSIASALPSPDELEQRATQMFTSSQIYDRDGNLLYELLDTEGGRRTYVPLDKISPWVQQATIATEDPRFYRHPGFDVFGIVRAVVQNVRQGDTISGASTIAQQLVLNLMLPEGRERSLTRKVREAVLAAEVTRQYPRDRILELYLNSINYGNLAYGIEAAARTYFDKDAAALTLAEASLLAGIPQAPAVYDPFTPEGREAVLARHKDVLRLMVEEDYITGEEAKLAAQAMENYEFKQSEHNFDVKAPHWVVYIRQLVEKEFGPEALYRGGLKIYTSLDPRLQAMAEQVVADQIAALQDKNVKNGALLALDPRTGEILAMVGSPDFNDDAIGGQINMTLRPRQTGSVIKPFTYLAAFEKGWSPATVLWDTPASYTDTAGNVYQPRNYDGKFHGPQTVRSSLANSYNIPAVKTLADGVGIPDFLALMRRLGVDTLTRPDYGPALTLGGGEVPLIEMTAAFGALANNGVYMPPVSLLLVEKSDGTPVCRFTPPGQDNQGLPACQLIENSGAQLVRPQHTYLLSNILSDNAARTPAFGANSVLNLSRPAAVKTGTTDDYRDNWTIGYTPDLITGVWVGNVDNKEMQGVSGVSGAGPIWHNFMEAALANRPVQDFLRPAGLVEREVCAWSGAEASPYCPDQRVELFVADQPPPKADQDVFQMLNCNGAEQVVLLVPDDVYDWAAQQGYPFPVATKSRCLSGSQHGDTTIFFSSPTDGATINGSVPLLGTVTMPNFEHYDLVYSRGWDNGSWEWISGPHQSQVTDGQLGEWNTLDVEDGEYTLAIVAYGQGGSRTEYKVRVRVQNSAPIGTPTPLITETPLPLPTETPLPTQTPLPTETPLPAETPTPEPTATLEPTPIETPAPTLTP